MKMKISEMVAKFAGPFIAVGKTIEERRNYLRSACTAWNIACHGDSKIRDRLLEQCFNVYKMYNPHCDSEDCAVFRQNMMKLIDEKRKLFASENVEIINCDIRITDEGKEEIIIASHK